MRTISVTELRQRVADVIEGARTTDEPMVVIQRSRRAAYIVNPDRFERDQAELSALRRVVFIREVREAEAEYASGAALRFEDVDALLDEFRS